MAKLIVFGFVLLVATAAIWSAPAEEFRALEMLPEAEAIEGQGVGDHLRFRRVTCDLFSFTWDTACAANCLSLGKAGGRCDEGICVCRQDLIKDLIEERFGNKTS